MLYAISLIAALAGLTAAQTYTDCNPLNSTCPPDPALGTSFNQTYGFDSSFDPNLWNFTAGQAQFGDLGASFQIVNPGDSVTTQTTFYIFFGRVEVWMQAASGQGIISSLVLLSDDLDEIDWEMMGGNTTFGENNYFGKGNQSERNAEYFPVSSPQAHFHNYTIDWTADKLEWHYDGQLIRTLLPDNATGGYPQTPSYFKMGVWAGGDPKESPGTIAWAGGPTNYAAGPFTMTIANVTVTDYSKGASSYVYGDNTGTWESIKVEKSGPSHQAQIAQAPPPENMQQKWTGLSTGAKIAIVAVPAGILAVLAVIGCFCCAKQRALGRRERAIEDAVWEKSQAEILSYRRQFTGTFGMNQGYQQIGHRTSAGNVI